MSWWNKLFSSYAFHEYFRGLTPQFIEPIETEDIIDSSDPTKPQDMIPSNVVPPQMEKYISPRVAKSPIVKNPVLSFKMRPGAAGFEQPEYDLTEVGRISDVEGYVNRAFLIKTGLMFKEGWELIGRNNLTIKYMKERFEQMSVATGIPMGIVLQHIGADLIESSNSFLVRVRSLKASGGQVRILPGTKIKLEPTAGYFPMHVSTVKFRRDEYGNVLQYRQQLPSGYYQDFESPDVLHFYYHRKEGFLVGTPSIIPVKDDIRALRRIEENIEMLLYQHLFPLYHYQVGTLEAPARMNPDGADEIQVVQGQINSMPSEGMIVTSERHKIVAIGAESRALRAESYLLHFKQRVFAGLGTSAIDFGDGDTSNRSTADSMSRNMVDDVKYYQMTMEMFVNEYIIKELMLESTFADPLSPENIVTFRFNEIDNDAKIKQENHSLNAFNSHALTFSELRHAFGKEPLTKEEWKDTFWELFEKPKSIIMAVDEPYTEEAKGQMVKKQAKTEAQGKGVSKEPVKKDKMSKGAVASADKPSNQHGQKTSPGKRNSAVSNQYAFDVVTDLWNNFKKSADKVITSNEELQTLIDTTNSTLKEKVNILARIRFREGIKDVYGEYVLNLDSQKILNEFNKLQQYIEHHIEQNNKILQGLTNDSKITIFDLLDIKTSYMINTVSQKAFNAGVNFGKVQRKMDS